MNFLTKKVRKGLGFSITALLLLGTTVAHAQALVPLSPNDVRIVFEKGVDDLKAKIETSKSLTDEERISLSKTIEVDADRLRADLKTVTDQAAILGGTTFVAGLIISYQGELNLPTSLFPKLAVAPGGEVGLAVFLRGNSYVSDAFAGAVAIIAGGSAKLTPGSAQQKQNEKGLRVKLLVSRNLSAHQTITLEDFSGAYVGVGGELNAFARSVNARIYTQPTSCANLNPANCSIFMLSVSTTPDITETTPVEATAKAVFVTFPYTYGDRP